MLFGIRPPFEGLSPTSRQIAHVLLTRSPLYASVLLQRFNARLACMRHAASVRSEPGSNSPKKIFIFLVRFGRKDFDPLGIDPFSIAYARYLVFKDPFPPFSMREI